MSRRVVIGVLGGVAAVVVAGGVALWALTRPPSADDVADRYLLALAEGDFDAIAPLLPDTLDADRLEATFAGATGRITDYTVTLTESDGVMGGRADVEIAGAPGVVFFALTQTDRGWMLAHDFLATLEATTTLGDSVLVGDSVELSGTQVPLLPAVYTVAAAPAGILEGSADVVVTNEAPVTVALDPVLSETAVEIAQEQLDAYATDCAARTATIPDSCGLRVPWAADLGALDDVAFRIEALPVLAIAEDGRSFDATDGVIVATASGTTRDGAAASFTYRSDDWALRGTLRFEGEEMLLLVR